ncbi:MAG: glycoside hydrolase family 3 N-terminal domain-containing protein [Oscillospiraceae bacterium]|nr:glycoside hydrolase family 3 N-terminal domain-containing protein [Oscillospiraceae bacterium]
MIISQASKDRARTLLGQMTLQEKAGQLNQRLMGFKCYEWTASGFTLTQDFKQEVSRCGGLGVLYGLFRADPWSGRGFANGLYGAKAMQAYNLTQRYVIEHSRLHIPMLLSSESPHGHQAPGGYLLPVNLAVGATFNPDLFRQAGRIVGRQLARQGVDLALISMLDILRDPRWGRSEECFGEDPYMASLFAAAITEAVESERVGVVAKHFCAQGETTGGINGSAARIGDRELHEIHLPAAAGCCRQQVTGIMAAYNEIDGVYCHANPELLTCILRKELGFDGLVMADGEAIDRLDSITGDGVRSAALALNAGVTVGLWDQAYTHLEEAVNRGLINPATLDAAVLRVLSLKYELGLFDRPYLDAQGQRTAGFTAAADAFRPFDPTACPESKALSDQVPVLLKNQAHILPLSPLTRQNIAVIGPNGDDIYRQIGDYSPELMPGSYCTLFQGLKQVFRQAGVKFCSGQSQTDAVALAQASDLLILALGGSSSRFEGAEFDTNGAAQGAGSVMMDCGEGMDSSSLRLPGRQETLFQALRQLNKPIITVMIAGRPYCLEDIAAGSDALLYAFYPGPWGGLSIAQIIAGLVQPSGRLPVSLPRSVGMLPVYYNQKPSGRVMTYQDTTPGPLFAFGSGQGYSELQYRDFRLRQSPTGACYLEGVVINQGKYRDCAVLQGYRRCLTAGFAARTSELIACEKVWLEAGQSLPVRLDLGTRVNLVYSLRRRYEHAEGRYQLSLMDQGRLLWRGELQLDARQLP